MYYFIVNGTAKGGKAKKLWLSLKKELDEQNIEYKAYKTTKSGDAGRFARKICEMQDSVKNLIVVGGDGTINETLNGITDFKNIKFAVIPSGSGNDFARGLNIKGKPVEILKHILASGVSQRIDIGKVNYKAEDKMNSRLFGISSGIGMDAIVCKKTIDSKQKKILNKIGLGSLTYVLLTIETLFSMKTYTVHMDVDNGCFERTIDKTIFAAVMNMKAEGGGVPMTPEASFVDGELSMCMAHTIPKWRTFFCLPVLVLGKHKKLKGFELIDGKKITINSQEPMVLHTDGEYCGDVTEVTFECLHNMLNIIR